MNFSNGPRTYAHIHSVRKTFTEQNRLHEQLDTILEERLNNNRMVNFNYEFSCYVELRPKSQSVRHQRW